MKKPTVEILINENPGRKRQKLVEPSGTITRLPTLASSENVTGKVIINLNSSKTFEHKGIKLELLGSIQTAKDQKDIMRFISLSKELSSPNTLNRDKTTFPFAFNNAPKQHETYRGASKNVKYILRLTIETRFRSLTYDQEFFVINPQPITSLDDEDNKPIQLEFDIDNVLHVLFDVQKSHYGVKGMLEGCFTFLKVGNRFSAMEMQIIRKEVENVSGAKPDTKVIVRYEIMDGGPIKNEVIPFVLDLKPYKLGPTMINIGNKFSVRYYINLVLNYDQSRVDRQHEIVLHRIEK